MLRSLMTSMALLGLLFVTGCGDTATDTASTATPDSTGGSDNSESATDQASDASSALALPDGVDPQAATAYESRKSASTPTAHAEFAQVSQFVGMELAQAGNDKGYAFFKQAASSIRKAKSGGLPIPDQQVASFIYNEACAFAKEGNVEAGMKSLGEAVSLGFSDMQLVKSDGDLESLRSQPGFTEKLQEWQTAATERAREEVLALLEKNEPFPFDFSLTDIEGNEQSLESYRGKVVMVDFWGTWCGPCVAEIPSFIELQKKHADDGFQILGLTYERGGSEEKQLERVKSFVEARGVNYPCMMGTPELKEMVPNFRAYPTTMLIGRSGKVRLMVVGSHPKEFFEAVIDVLLAEDAA